MPAALPKLQPNDAVDNQFWIVSKLGEGGFGAVYKVKDANCNLYALKIESSQLKTPVLKMDVYIMEQLGHNRHFCTVYGKGKTDEFNFVAMTLVSSSLLDLRKARKDQHFTVSTVVRAGLQCLEGIEAMHRIGFLHRDIKPGNYAIGREEVQQQRLIYILDFGLCRKYLSEEGNRMRTPRAKAAFRGTIRYAPLSCHRQVELAPKDDVETWFYQQVEMTKGMVPWKMEVTRDSVGQFKENIRLPGHPNRVDMFRKVPEEYETIFNHITSLSYYTMPDYKKIKQLLNQIAQKNGVTSLQLYDWESPCDAKTQYTQISSEVHPVRSVSITDSRNTARGPPSAQRPPPHDPTRSQVKSSYAVAPSARGSSKSKMGSAPPTAGSNSRVMAIGKTEKGQTIYSNQPKSIPFAQMMADIQARKNKKTS